MISELNSQQSRFLARLGINVHVMHLTLKKKTLYNMQGFSDLPLLEIHIHQCWMLKREKGENEKGVKSYAEVPTSVLESLKLT